MQRVRLASLPGCNDELVLRGSTVTVFMSHRISLWDTDSADTPARTASERAVCKEESERHEWPRQRHCIFYCVSLGWRDFPPIAQATAAFIECGGGHVAVVPAMPECPVTLGHSALV
jgi:hypothetical protein